MSIIKVYANLVINGKIKLSDVPLKHRLAVETYINQLNI